MRLTALVLWLGLLSAASITSAQVVTPNVVVRPSQGLNLVIPRVTGESYASMREGYGSATAGLDAPTAPVSALANFEVVFHAGDHKFRRVQVFPDGAVARFALNDSNEDDAFAAHARWYNFSSGQSASVSGVGGGRQVLRMPIPPGPANHTFALRGFEFRRADGTDANIRTLAISLASDGAAVETILSDNEGPDLRLGGPLVAGRAGPDIGRRYNVTVHYVWLPNAVIASTGAITGHQTGRDSAAMPTSRVVLRGFSFQFSNGDHHIQRIQINNADGGMAWFHDGNRDDPVRWQVDYAALR